MNCIKWFFRVIKDLLIKHEQDNADLNLLKEPHKIMCFNVERDKSSKNDWPNRRDSIIELINREKPTIICMQELMPHQFKFLNSRLAKNYDSYFIDAFTGRSKGMIVSEGLSIFYAKDKYHLMDKGFIRLTDKFGFENKHWRICQWIKLGIKRDFSREAKYEELYIFNTHLDHKSRDARKDSIDMILNVIDSFKDCIDYLPTKSKFFICGDFNAEITWNDLSKLSDWNSYYFNEGTIIDRNVCIDYIFTQNVNGEYKRINTKLSDHYPIILTEYEA